MPDLSPEDLATLQTALLALAAAVFTALGVLAIAASRRALKYLSALTGVKESDALQSSIDNAITGGIHYAEEWADKRIRKIGAKDVDGDDKRSVAKDFARSIAPKALAEVSETQLDMLVDAKVQSLRPLMSAPISPSSAPPGMNSINPSAGGTSYQPSLPAASRLPEVSPALPTPVPRRKQ